MDKAKSFIEWIKNRSFRIFLFFILIYVWWFLLTPWDTRSVNPYDAVYLRRFTYANGNYLFGLILLSLYSASVIFTRLTKNHSCWSALFSLTTVFFLVINGLYTAWALPRIDDAAFENTTTYLVVHYPTWPDRPYTVYQFTKWSWFFKYYSDEIYVNHRLNLRYDEKLQRVNVVTVFPTGYERLEYSDGEPAIYYDPWEIDFEGKRYYPSTVCNPNLNHHFNCKSYTYTVYQCELDNTLCVPLPFRYTGDYYHWFYIEEGATANDINISFDIGAYPGVKTLIFTYGDNPRCQVHGCEMLEAP